MAEPAKTNQFAIAVGSGVVLIIISLFATWAFDRLTTPANQLPPATEIASSPRASPVDSPGGSRPPSAPATGPDLLIGDIKVERAAGSHPAVWEVTFGVHNSTDVAMANCEVGSTSNLGPAAAIVGLIDASSRDLIKAIGPGGGAIGFVAFYNPRSGDVAGTFWVNCGKSKSDIRRFSFTA